MILAQAVGYTFNKAQLKIYLEVLANYHVEDVLHGIRHLLHHHKYNTMPTPGAIVEAFSETLEARAHAAWNILMETIRSAGAWQSVRFEDPRLCFAVEFLGGWQAVCAWKEKDDPYNRAAFLKAYIHAPARVRPKTFPGLIERENVASGWLDHLPPVLVVKHDGTMIEGVPNLVLAEPQQEKGDTQSLSHILKEEISHAVTTTAID